MSEFFTEVDEAMKQERLEKLWRDYGGVLISFLAMIVFVTAANATYHAWIQKRNFKQTDLYINTLEKENLAADDLLEILPKMSTGMKGIVSIKAAGIAMDNGNTDKALNIYKSIVAAPEQQTQNPMIYDLAKYMATNLDKELSTDEKISRLETMAGQESNPFRYNALLDIALIEATQNKNFAEARTHLEKLIKADSNAPQSLRQKAASLDILYQAEQSDKP